MTASQPDGHLVVGWREWVALPELGIHHIKAKVDTGARTSALHSFNLEHYHDRGAPHVRFGVHPLQGDCETEVWCDAPVSDRRRVSDSGGHHELRYIIVTPLRLGGQCWPVEMTLTDRDSMLFRFLLGRAAMSSLVVDPSASYLVD